MSNIIKFNTSSGYMHQVEICRLHLENYRLYESGEYPGTNLACLSQNGAIRDKLHLLLLNLSSQYDNKTIILALRSLKMYNYCKKYLKVG